MVERASLASLPDLQGPSPNQILPPTSPLMTGLLVTISHPLVALLPTTQKSPSAKPTVAVAQIIAPASIKRFIVFAPAAMNAGKQRVNEKRSASQWLA
jgi:hypothetical protein